MERWCATPGAVTRKPMRNMLAASARLMTSRLCADYRAIELDLEP